MGGSRRSLRAFCTLSVPLAVFSALGVACSSGPDARELDLTTNERLYQPTGYRVQVPTDRSIVLLPVADQRGTTPLEASDGGYPIRWMADNYWAKPMPSMVYELLLRELSESGIATEVTSVPDPAPSDLLLEVQLLDARTGLEEREYGRRAVANAAFRVILRGARDGLGTRRVLLDETVQQSYESKVDPHPPLLPPSFGVALRGAIGKTLLLVDQTNATRSGLSAPSASAPSTSNGR